MRRFFGFKGFKGKLVGFTLAELLIALVILGVIATFTIPKVLQSQQSSQFKSVAKEMAGTISGAYQAYQSHNTVSGSTRFTDLTPYMNYVQYTTTGLVDDVQTWTTIDCGVKICYRFANGAMLIIENNNPLNATASTNAFQVVIDPDGKVTGTGAGTDPGKSVAFDLYFNGRLVTEGDLLPNSYCNGTGCSAQPGNVPPWFGWN